MSQVLEVVTVKAGDQKLVGERFKSVKSLAKKMSANDSVVVLELNGTKASIEMTEVGYRLVTKKEEAVSYTRPMAKDKVTA